MVIVGKRVLLREARVAGLKIMTAEPEEGSPFATKLVIAVVV